MEDGGAEDGGAEDGGDAEDGGAGVGNGLGVAPVEAQAPDNAAIEITIA